MQKTNNHRTAFVDLEAWEFSSPEEKLHGKYIDLGLLAESLIYYDNLIIQLTTEKQLEQLILWFVKNDKFEILLDFLRDGTIKFFYYSFMTTAISNEGVYSLWNMQFPPQNKSDFVRLILYPANLAPFLNSGKKARLYELMEKSFIDETADGYDTPVEDARRTMHDTDKYSFIVQTYVNELYRSLSIDNPPVIKTDIISDSGSQFTLKANVNFDDLNALSKGNLGLRGDLPLIGEVQSNRFIWTASKYNWDLYLGSVMSTILSFKLRESSKKSHKTEEVIKALEGKVEFPNIRSEVNSGNLDLGFILEIRSKSKKFRQWLQSESDRDRDALIAYHKEVSKNVGITRLSSSQIKFIGNLGQAGFPVLAVLQPEVSPLIALGATAGSTFLTMIADMIDNSWKPIVFGDWLTKEVKRKK